MARTTTRSGRREMNPTDAYRKLQRKKEVQKNKKERKKVREFSAMVRNPDLMVEEVSREGGGGAKGREGGLGLERITHTRRERERGADVDGQIDRQDRQDSTPEMQRLMQSERRSCIIFYF